MKARTILATLQLRQARTQELVEYADWYRAALAAGKGDPYTANSWRAFGNHAGGLAGAALTLYTP